jgi:hypothetical protein
LVRGDPAHAPLGEFGDPACQRHADSILLEHQDDGEPERLVRRQLAVFTAPRFRGHPWRHDPLLQHVPGIPVRHAQSPCQFADLHE